MSERRQMQMMEAAELPLQTVEKPKVYNSTKFHSNLSYEQFISDRKAFLQAGTYNGFEFNLFDNPSQCYFKILFYFYNGDEEFNDTGLLAPTWQYYDNSGNFYNYNSAWAFLKMNDENERAEKLEQFVSLLSEINSKSPWYWKEITGIDEALNRKEVTSKDFKFDEERQKISIKCMPDSVDHRIGKLLDLYRDIVFSWSLKKEIVPANLRKFDMAIYIYDSPISNLSVTTFPNNSERDYGELDETSNHYASSYKMIEFHNCEIDYNSSKSGYGNFNNETGVGQEFSIDIFFDDCYERRYDEFSIRTIGDVITTDTALVFFNEDGTSLYKEKSIPQGSETSYYNNYRTIMTRNNQLLERLNNPLINKTNYNVEIKNISNKEKIIGNTVEQSLGYVTKKMSNVVQHAYLGNIYGLSVSNLAHNIKDFMNGDVIGSISKEVNKIKGNKKYINKYSNKSLGNIFKANTLANNI